MIDAELLKILCCPESHQGLTAADPAIVARLNTEMASGGLKARGGQIVWNKLDGGLVREDGKFLYPVRQNIPVMLIDEAIPLGSPAAEQR